MADDLGKTIRNQAIDDCIKLASKWRDDFKEFSSDRNTVAANVLTNLITAMTKLKTS